MRIARGFVIVTIALLLASCGSDGESSSARPSGPEQGSGGDAASGGDDASPELDPGTTTDLLGLDVCTLLSSEEVEGIVGNPVGAGESLPLVCSWDGAELEDVTATIGLIPSFGGEDPCASLGSGQDYVEVSGMGERAYWRFAEAGSFNVGSLEVCAGELAVDVELAGAGDDATLRSAAEELAGLVLGRL